MIFYLNRGFVVEQAIAQLIHDYFDKLKLDEFYENFHLTITNNHPFAHLILHEKSEKTADMFPSIVVTTQSDGKVPELMNMPTQVSKIQLNEEDIESITNNRRVKTKIVDGEKIPVKKKNGEFSYEMIPGYCVIIEETQKEKLLEACEEMGFVNGISLVSRKRDSMSIEIWCDNNQLKNEIYEQLRIFFATSFEDAFKQTYAVFDPAIFDGTIRGERSNNYNFDFDIALYGSHITFDVDYNIGQIIIDTEIADIDGEIIPEVINHVKE